jgi:hypothetical protein
MNRNAVFRINFAETKLRFEANRTTRDRTAVPLIHSWGAELQLLRYILMELNRGSPDTFTRNRSAITVINSSGTELFLIANYCSSTTFLRSRAAVLQWERE